MNTRRQGQQGIALILTVGTLALLAILGIVFSTAMRIENATASNYLYALQARYMAESGIERAIHDLRWHPTQGCAYIDVDHDTENWFFPLVGADLETEVDARLAAPLVNTATISYDGDENADGVIVAAEEGDGISGRIPGAGTYSLKVMDCASQIYVNDTNPGLNTMLNRLANRLFGNGGIEGQAIYTYYINGGSFAGSPPYTITPRPFYTKEQIKQAGITNGQYGLMRDFVTAFAYRDDQTLWDDLSDSIIAPRAPLNVNTASFQVLDAAFGQALTAAQIYAVQNNRPYANLMDFRNVIRSDPAFSAAQAEQFIQMTDPNRRKDPSDPNTTDLCFNSGGLYEIESLGRAIVTDGGRQIEIARTRLLTVVRIFDTHKETLANPCSDIFGNAPPHPYFRFPYDENNRLYRDVAAYEQNYRYENTDAILAENLDGTAAFKNNLFTFEQNAAAPPSSGDFDNAINWFFPHLGGAGNTNNGGIRRVSWYDSCPVINSDTENWSGTTVTTVNDSLKLGFWEDFESFNVGDDHPEFFKQRFPAQYSGFVDTSHQDSWFQVQNGPNGTKVYKALDETADPLSRPFGLSPFNWPYRTLGPPGSKRWSLISTGGNSGVNTNYGYSLQVEMGDDNQHFTGIKETVPPFFRDYNAGNNVGRLKLNNGVENAGGQAKALSVFINSNNANTTYDDQKKPGPGSPSPPWYTTLPPTRPNVSYIPGLYMTGRDPNEPMPPPWGWDTDLCVNVENNYVGFNPLSSVGGTPSVGYEIPVANQWRYFRPFSSFSPAPGYPNYPVKIFRLTLQVPPTAPAPSFVGIDVSLRDPGDTRLLMDNTNCPDTYVYALPGTVYGGQDLYYNNILPNGRLALYGEIKNFYIDNLRIIPQTGYYASFPLTLQNADIPTTNIVISSAADIPATADPDSEQAGLMFRMLATDLITPMSGWIGNNWTTDWLVLDTQTPATQSPLMVFQSPTNVMQYVVRLSTQDYRGNAVGSPPPYYSETPVLEEVVFQYTTPVQYLYYKEEY